VFGGQPKCICVEEACERSAKLVRQKTAPAEGSEGLETGRNPTQKNHSIIE